MRLLLVEDEKRFGSFLQKALQSESYAVDWLLNGREGYEQASIESYDVIILDINLPELSGLEIIKLLRDEGITTPVIMLTALGQVSDKVRGLDYGADDYVVKPVDADELLARIRSVLRRPKKSDPTIYRMSDLIVNTSTREVSRNGEQVKLTLKEYSLLEYLIRNASRVVARQELIDHVWDGDIDPLSNTIDVYVGYLRTKIDKNFPNKPPLLQTVHGVGYRLSS